jgi:penicillin-binding protein 2
MPAFDKKDKSRYATFSRRALLVSGGMTAVFGILAGRLYQLQIVEGDLYKTRAEDNRINDRLLAPPRGRIIDRFGVVLASNRRNYRALLVPEQTQGGVAKTLDALAGIIQISDDDRARILKDAAQKRSFVAITVAENLSWEDFSRLSLDLLYLAGVQPDVGETRDYPFGSEFSHVLGYVASVNLEDLRSDADPLLGLPGFKIGKRGIEKILEKEIRGRAGVSRVEVNVHGRVIRELARNPSTPGEDVYLTIDRELQQFACEHLKDQSAACAVMDVETGDVLALASTPGFDPNAFNTGLSSVAWNALLEDDYTPLLNKTVSGTYFPGSTFKPVMAIAALDTGTIEPDFAVTCTGQITLGGRDFHCWKKGGHGRLDLAGALQHSCDVYFYTVALRLGIDKIETYAKRLGLGALTGIELPGEKPGLVPSPAWKQATFGRPWQQGETLNTAIGQGDLKVTPLQLCTVTARLASGKLVSPHIVHAIGGSLKSGTVAPSLGISEDVLAAVRSGMEAVTNQPGGTAYSWRITEPGFEMAGKTGTAQVRDISKQERAGGVRSNESLAWKLRDHGLFIAYAPVSKPRYACAVVIEHGAEAAHPQVQLARDVLLQAQQRDLANRPLAFPVRAASLSPQNSAETQ